MEKIFYIDSNIFIFAYSDYSNIGVICRKILHMIINSKITSFTSILTFDEIFYKITKLKDRETALIIIESFLNLKNLNFIEVNLNTINYSLSLLKNYNLKPRDAIHLACALNKNIKNIISNDKDFDNVKEIKRYDIKGFN